ncbi:hypothetical protein [Nonlabens ulvanivorans]|uniref:tRNA (Guanine-N1)-methyltransferase n=1 Tax=Nonlabens ulvanivorans TaxID=906888 RepID=A0ABX5E638_NONUL|nr:hypothetical protein [Nonlabens ulvanivorans]PRX14560.1 hypothetical protein LY02_01591 [Nonlabens ulvanivorans]
MKHTTLILSSLLCLNALAQENEPIQEITTIKAKFEQTIDEANRYQDFKVIKQSKLQELKKQTVERIDGLKDSIKVLEEQIVTKDKKTIALEDQITSKDAELEKIDQEKDSISLFGIMLDKVTYNLILWSIIGILLLALVIFIFKYRSSNEITNVSQTNLKLAEEELESYKRRSLEKEQQLSRQLMDERKKNTGNN